MDFNLTSQYLPTGDQPEAIRQLVEGLERDEMHQILLGVTGSGKTFTMANVKCGRRRMEFLRPRHVLLHLSKVHAE